MLTSNHAGTGSLGRILRAVPRHRVASFQDSVHPGQERVGGRALLLCNSQSWHRGSVERPIPLCYLTELVKMSGKVKFEKKQTLPDFIFHYTELGTSKRKLL